MHHQDRFKIVLAASYRTPNGSVRTAELSEIWSQGCRLRHATGLPTGAKIDLRVNKMGPFAARVVDVVGEISEVRFCQPLYPPILAHLVDRALQPTSPQSPAPEATASHTGWRPQRPVA